MDLQTALFPVRKKLLVSFSGGATSGFMLHTILTSPLKDEYEIKVVFANTGKEDEETLKFVQRVADEWAVKIIWVEAYPRTEKGWGVSHKVVDFQTAARNGEPFEAMIAKLGIPNAGNAPFCSDQLKRKPIESYLKSIGWRKYYKAIGIRCDEIDRVNPNHKKLRIVYPLIAPHPRTKLDVFFFWSRQQFKLEVEPGFGNCDNCLKKSLKDLAKNAKARPESFNWWKSMTEKYGHLNPRNTNLKPPFNFFRGNMSPDDIKAVAQMQEQEINVLAENERLDGCSESCEAF